MLGVVAGTCKPLLEAWGPATETLMCQGFLAAQVYR